MKTFSIIVVVLLLVLITVSGNDILKMDRHSPVAEGSGFRKDILKPAELIKIYLTIDDGPSEASFYLSNIAMADSVPLNVFAVGDSVYKNESSRIFFQLYQLNPFIEISNHSFSHANNHYQLYYEHPAEVATDFELNKDTLGLQDKIARLPGRNTWRLHGRKRTDLPDDSTAADLLAAKGYRIFGWDIEWRCLSDSTHSLQTVVSVFRRIETAIKNKSSFTPAHIVILCHESMFTDSTSRLQLDSLLKKIKRTRGYQLERLSNYP